MTARYVTGEAPVSTRWRAARADAGAFDLLLD